MLRAQGATTVLGLRDVMDEPTLLRREWQQKNVMPALAEQYDEIWVFGLEQMGDPLSGLEVPGSVREKTIYTAYLPHLMPQDRVLRSTVSMNEPYLLVTAGGGGDGAPMIDWVLRAYERDRSLPYPALFVFGPFMPPLLRRQFRNRVARLDRAEAIDFDSRMEVLMGHAAGVVAMGGYNTFCEILSFDKRALIIPRTKPRQEQIIRASRAQQLGLVRMLDAEGERKPHIMAKALHELPGQQTPSEAGMTGMLEGLVNVNRLVEQRIASRRRPAWLPSAQTQT